MAGRRILYITLLAAAAVFHFAYGQYVTYYVLLFLLCLPVLSLLVSIPAALFSRALLRGGADVCRGRESSVRLSAECRFFIPPEMWKFTVEKQNLFTESRAEKQKLRIRSAGTLSENFDPDTTQLGTIRYRIRSARICDYLGLFTLPIRKGGPAFVTVLPDKEQPMPEPEIVDPAERVFKPKPQGFSEEHELRPYRDGDPLNLIHWKLSEKYDSVIVREPQELVRKKVVLSVDLPYKYEERQSVLEQLRYLNDLMIENGLSYTLQFGRKALEIASENDFMDFLRPVLSEPMQAQKALPVDLGHNMLIYRIKPNKGARI